MMHTAQDILPGW